MSNVFITISKLFLFLLNFLSSNKFLQQIAVKSNAKGEFHAQKERKQQKGEVKGKRLFVKLKRATGEMSQKQRNGQRGKNNIKKVRKRLLCWQSKSTLAFGKAS